MGVWMAGQSNAAPVIIKRKKNIVGGGHHGGAWKVAYADFVTAMMAFFMLMWLLNATTEKQRKGIADYFNPTIPINRISGGGDGAFGGDSVFSEQTLTQMGTGASAEHTSERDKARGDAGEAGAQAETAQLEEVERKLLAMSGESMAMERLMRHVVTRVTDEGLVIEVFELPEQTLFQADAAQPTDRLVQIVQALGQTLAITGNDLAVKGHVPAYPITLIDNPVWRLSSDRAMQVRLLLQGAGLAEARFARVSGHADNAPAAPDPFALRNSRIEIVLLRRQAG